MNKDEFIIVRVTIELKEDLKEVAKEEGLNLSTFIRQVLEDAAS